MATGKLKGLLSFGKDDYGEGRGGLPIMSALVVLVLLLSVVGWYWSAEPDFFSVTDNATAIVEEKGGKVVIGSTTTAALIRVASTLLDKNGGFLSNDVVPWLDNLPHWEYGVLVQVRDLARSMRDNLSRSQSQSREDSDLELAESRFNISHKSWFFPSAESQYAEGIDKLGSYLERLSDVQESDAQFYARADNMRYWLGTVDSRLGSLSQRLSASVGQKRLNTDLAGDSAATQSTDAPDELAVKTPFFEIDDVFYEARGTSWALIHFLKAIEVDFNDILQKKNALVSLGQIIRELEGTQEAIFSPMILNGSGFGFLANHSLVMASYISRAHSGIIELRDLLSKG